MKQSSPAKREVRKERTQWRDEGISQRHRKYGWDCPGLDVDLLLIEYDTAEPKALVEYKNQHYNRENTSKATYKALVKLGDKAELPVFVAVYADDYSWFRLTPMNDIARKYIEKQTTMTEKDYVSLLYKLRGRTLPKDIAEVLNG